MSSNKTHAENEFNILEKTVENAIATPFRDEINALVKKFNNSGQSGGSAPITAEVISSVVKNLCLGKPICPITGIKEEWFKHDKEEGPDNKIYYQNIRLGSVFKEEDGKAYYLNAIFFNGNLSNSPFTSNSVKMPDGTLLRSRQFIKSFPFKPKTFYIDVIETRFDKDKDTGILTPNPQGDWWESEIKDVSQLDEVKEYYDLVFIEQ